MSYENPWLYENQIAESNLIDKYYGFVYNITNMQNNRKYIGKKLFWSSRTRIVNKKKKKHKVESDWKNYYGSSEELKADIIKYGKLNFKRDILQLCVSKGECNYFEAKYQFSERVLESDDYYNSWISCKIHKNHVKMLHDVDKKDKA